MTLPADPLPHRREDSESTQPGLLIVSSHLSASGRGRTPSEDLALRLAAAGFPITVTSQKLPIAARAIDMLLTTVTSRRRYQVGLVDVFSGRAFRYAEAISTVLAKLGKPIILSLHGGDLPAFAQRHPKRVDRLFRRATAITSPSAFLARSLRGFGEIKVIPNPIDCSFFTPRAQPRVGKPSRIVWLRAFHKIYRPHDAVHIAARVHDLYPDTQLTMIGPDKGDSALSEVRAAIRQHQAEQFVDPLAEAIPHSAVPDQLTRADLFLNTSSIDNAPVSVLEAMACGLPVVSTNAGGLPDLLREGETALLAEVGAINALALALCKLIEDQALYTKLRTNGLNQARQYDWSVVLPQWISLVQDAAQRPGPRR